MRIKENDLIDRLGPLLNASNKAYKSRILKEFAEVLPMMDRKITKRGQGVEGDQTSYSGLAEPSLRFWLNWGKKSGLRLKDIIKVVKNKKEILPLSYVKTGQEFGKATKRNVEKSLERFSSEDLWDVMNLCQKLIREAA